MSFQILGNRQKGLILKLLEASLVVALKELLQLSREPLALFVGVVIPAIGLPVFGGIIGGYASRQMRGNATATYNLGASKQDHQRYIELGWNWFRRSEFGTDNPDKLQKLAEELQFGAAPQASGATHAKIEDANAFAQWCKSVAANYRSNIAAVSADVLAQEVRHPELFQVVVNGIGKVNVIEYSFSDDLRESTEAAKKVIENKSVDVFLKGQESPVRAADGSLTQRHDWTVVYDATRPQSSQAHGIVSRFLEICNAPSSGAGKAAQSAIENEIDIGVGAPLRPGERAAIEGMSVFGACGVLILAMSSVASFSTEFGVAEREKKTIEPLLITASSRMSIALGKYLATVLAAFTASCFTVVCMWLIMRGMISKEMFPYADDSVMGTTTTILLLSSLLLPLILGCSGVTLATSFAASSSRMAAYLNNIFVWSIISITLVMFVGVNASTGTSFVPILGVMLLIKSVFNGRFDLMLFAIAMVSSMVFAFAGLLMAVHFANRESVIYGV